MCFNSISFNFVVDNLFGLEVGILILYCGVVVGSVIVVNFKFDYVEFNVLIDE